MRPLLAAFLLLPLTAVLAHGEMQGETAFGRPADPAHAKRTVRVEMTDQMRFQPAEITVKRNEIVSTTSSTWRMSRRAGKA